MAGGQPPNDLLDQRDQLVSELSQIVDVKVLRAGQRQVQRLHRQRPVAGGWATSAATMKAVQSAADPTRTAVALVGLAGNVSELSDNVITGGSLGGLMAFRAQTLIPTQNAIGRLAMAVSAAPSTTSTTWASTSTARWAPTSSRPPRPACSPTRRTPATWCCRRSVTDTNEAHAPATIRCEVKRRGGHADLRR